MKVKCIKIYNEFEKDYQEKSSWITIGKEYIVFGIQIRLDAVYFLIVSDSNEQPILQNACQFEVLTKKIPTNWQLMAGVLELLTIGPESWYKPDFWDSCYEGDPAALAIYKREARIIIQEENIL